MSELEPIERAAFLNELRAAFQGYKPMSGNSVKDFLALVNARVAQGAKEYGDASPQREFAELIGEMEQEAADIAGWACQAWRRVGHLSSNKTLHKDHPLVILSNMLIQRAEDAFHLWDDLRYLREGIATRCDQIRA